jgi:threonylcarbamoyladenosine tRNA methylthiotransferase MtaB
MRIAVSTLGCKINQYESDLLRRDLESHGTELVPFTGDADVYVINTCTVTAKSDAQCRQAIRAATRRGAKVVVTGCYATTRPAEIRAIPGVHLIVPNSDKAAIADAVLRLGNAGATPASPSRSGPAVFVRSRTRGFLKIQDGCDGGCSYCIVPRARGASRSVPLQDVIAAFDGLVSSGCPEVVLSGIHIGRYGEDLPEGTSLSGLVTMLLDRRATARLRLSSIEPREVGTGLIDRIGLGLCRHLHIPLQSGDDAILASMRRDYDAGFYRDLLERVAQKVPGIALGADVMVGFPGEGEREFMNTLQLIEQSPLTHLHVFAFSPRPGTEAALMRDQVPEAAKKERSEALRELGKKKNRAFRESLLGRELSVVVEGKEDRSGSGLTGLTDNYVRVVISGAKRDVVGKEVKARITEVQDGETISIPV